MRAARRRAPWVCLLGVLASLACLAPASAAGPSGAQGGQVVAHLGDGATLTVGAASAPGGGGSRGVLATVLVVAGTVLIVAALVGAAVLLLRRTSGRTSRRSRRSAGVGADSSAVWTVDRALRALAAECQRAGTPVPQPYLVTVDADDISLRLTAPRSTAPSPWTVTDQGRRWDAALRDLQTVPVSDQAGTLFPCLVALGDTDDGLVLLDLSKARGVISVDGDPAMVSGLLDDWEEQLRGNPWSAQELPLVRVDAGGAARPGTVVVASLAAAVDEMAEQRDGVLVVGSPLSRRERGVLGSLVQAPDASWTVVVGGEVQHARWRFTVSRTGSLQTEILSTAVDTHLTDR